MSVYEHITEFAGLPVVDFLSDDIEEERYQKARRHAGADGARVEPDDGAYAAALADPGSVAWRLRVSSYDPQEPFEEYFARFLAEVDTARVGALVIGCWGESYEVDASVPRDLLVGNAGRFPALRALFLGEYLAEEAEISWIQQTDVTPLLAAFPALRELTVRGGERLEFPATGHEALASLTVQTGGLPGEAVAGILASDLPALERLELWFGVEDYGGTTTVETLEPLLSGKVFPSLRHLGPRNSPWGDDLVRALAGAPVLRRIRVLDLSGHVLRDEGGRVLASAPAFRGLERLVLRYHFLSEPVMAELRAALAGVDLDLSGPEEPDAYKDEVYYYPEVTE
ncbi:STM4015 family protein [Actinorugispora endophytica]|uniref:Leucine rich repeat (LRR) protein n=1 Tax=Actinorugispora endophytica TaxID=1605990 RepID=A0A4R6V170_9ACTN|nr:STM4015 family protein [Actinorugispora endophytica]TDQ53785.1 hypothetical protein EV190_103236 [Actinorugispora endophytica]